MQTTTLSGPSATIAGARSLLTDAGYRVLDDPATPIELGKGEVALSVDGGHNDGLTIVVAHLGWRRRSVMGHA